MDRELVDSGGRKADRASVEDGLELGVPTSSR